MQKTTIFSKWLSCITFLIFFSFTHAQCPSNFNDWTNFNRITYDGNWLLAENVLGYATNPSPVRTVLLSNENDDGFGLNDYDSDNNFTSIPVTLANSPVIRVGKKFNQTGQGELSPVRRANVATFTFNPTVNNCKIRVHYIGILQELSDDPNFYKGGINENIGGALQRFRRTVNSPVPTTAARNAATFGLICSYQYGANTTNIVNMLQ